MVRRGDTITGYDSANGTRWDKVGTVTLAGLPATAQTGLFATSPGHNVTLSQSSFGASATSATTQDTGSFDRLTLGGAWPAGAWTHSAVGDTNGPAGLATAR